MVDEGWLDRAKVHGAMILCGAGYGGYFVFSKACLTGGVDPFVFSMYRDCIGCITLFVYASVFERYDVYFKVLPIFQNSYVQSWRLVVSMQDAFLHAA